LAHRGRKRMSAVEVLSGLVLLKLSFSHFGPQRRFGNVRFSAAYGGKAEGGATFAKRRFGPDADIAHLKSSRVIRCAIGVL
jgi:hypothetical protein